MGFKRLNKLNCFYEQRHRTLFAYGTVIFSSIIKPPFSEIEVFHDIILLIRYKAELSRESL
jgi:hypothetical protein